jgi:hypothetical protein
LTVLFLDGEAADRMGRESAQNITTLLFASFLSSISDNEELEEEALAV